MSHHMVDLAGERVAQDKALCFVLDQKTGGESEENGEPKKKKPKKNPKKNTNKDKTKAGTSF